MNFLERALPLIQRGLFVIPVSAPIPGEGTGRKHGDSKKTGFRFSGSTPEFHCFNTACSGYTMTFGQVVAHLNKLHEKYPGKIWEENDDDLEWAEIEAADVMPENRAATGVYAEGEEEPCYRDNCNCGAEHPAVAHDDHAAQSDSSAVATRGVPEDLHTTYVLVKSVMADFSCTLIENGYVANEGLFGRRACRLWDCRSVPIDRDSEGTMGEALTAEKLKGIAPRQGL
jgi:hypothetical protein